MNMVIEFLRKRLRKKSILLMKANEEVETLRIELSYFKQKDKETRKENHELREALKKIISQN